MISPEQSSILGLVSSFLGDKHYPSTTTERAVVAENSLQREYQEPHVNIVIFSKDRPWQLQQLFRSMHLVDTFSGEEDILVSLHVLLHITDNYREAYDEVITSVGRILESVPNISFACHREDPDDVCSFQNLFDSILLAEEYQPTHWMFLTDDAILLISLRKLLQTATFALSSTAELKCFLSRLHPGITWTQTRNLPSPPPRSCLRYLPGRSPIDSGVYVYPLARGDLDWAYPWDLSGGVYPHSVVQTVFEQLRGTDGLSHPNWMEISGNRAITLVTHNFWIAIPTYPMMLILAINRVQAVCQAPLACPETVASTLSSAALLRYYLEKKQLDIAKYKARHFNSAHVGNLFLLPDSRKKNDLEWDVVEGERVEFGFAGAKPALSVLIPVHTGPSEVAAHAIRSILMQPIEEYRCMIHQHGQQSSSPYDLPWLTLSPMQVVVVDDRCVDGSINAMIETMEQVAAEYPFVKVTCKDYRLGHSSVEDKILADSSIGSEPVALSVEIISSSMPGVAAALNHGLSHCKSDFVARMDADDIAAPFRLKEQIAALRCRSDADVVGTSIVLFRETAICLSESELGNDEPPVKMISSRLPSSALPYSASHTYENDATIDVITSFQPTDAGFVAWTMLFSCSIAHPSVVCRRTAVVKCGGYDETYSFAEDYNLWLRMTMQKCRSIVSIPRLGLWHRKHRSRPQRASKQAEEALRASIAFMKALLEQSPDSEWNLSRLASAANILRKPDTASSLHQLNEASELLIALEAAFLCYHSDALTSREVALIGKDCGERLGELATLAVERSLVAPSQINDSLAWRVWCERCPELTMNRIALLCHSNCGNKSI